MCADSHTNDLGEFVKTHTRACSLRCMKEGGLGIVTSDGKFVALDAKGAPKAAEVLKTSKSKSDPVVEATGSLEGDMLVVDTIKEVAASGQ